MTNVLASALGLRKRWRPVVNTSTKLVERIFLNLPMRDILVNVQRVSTQWHYLVQNSKPLQEALFFKPIFDRPLTFVRLRRDIEDEQAIKASRTPVAPNLVRQKSAPTRSSTVGHLKAIAETSASAGDSKGHSDDLPYSKRDGSTGDFPPSSTFFQRLRTKSSKIFSPQRHGSLKKASSSANISASVAKTSFEDHRKSNGTWVPRFYTVDEKRDVRQQIYAHPLVSWRDSAYMRYSDPIIGGQDKASWRRQLVTQPPVANMRVVYNARGEEMNILIRASDESGVRLEDVVGTMKKKNAEDMKKDSVLGMMKEESVTLKTDSMVFLGYEGMQWWRPCEWTRSSCVNILESVNEGPGEGPWTENGGSGFAEQITH